MNDLLSKHKVADASSAKGGAAVAMPKGAWPVMLTPFTQAGDIDWPAYDRLIDWYLAAGVSGLFSVCLSSELHTLSDAERVALAKHTVQRAGGRVPVIGVGASPAGAALATLADTVGRMKDTGLDAVVCLTNNFCPQDAPEEQWCNEVEALLERVDPAIALGIYECPLPHARNISASALGRLARTGRFVLTKDTCCDLPTIHSKIQAAQGTSLRFYNADARTLLASLNAGGYGYSGIAANYFPHLFSWMCAQYERQPELAAELDLFFKASTGVVHTLYMQAAKVYLQREGLELGLRTRVGEHVFTPEHIAALDALQREVKQWEERLNVDSPFAAVSSAVR